MDKLRLQPKGSAELFGRVLIPPWRERASRLSSFLPTESPFIHSLLKRIPAALENPFKTTDYVRLRPVMAAGTT